MTFAFSTVFYLLVAHIVGDFFLQSQKMAEGKSGPAWSGWLALHCLFYFVVLLFASPAIFQSYRGMEFTQVHFVFASVSSILHLGVDMFSSVAYKHFAKSDGFKRGFFNTLGVDQFVHIILLFALVGAMAKSNF